MAGFSYKHWQAAIHRQPVQALLRQPSFMFLCWFGAAMIAGGLAGGSKGTWELVAWSGFALVFLIFTVQAAFALKKNV